MHTTLKKPIRDPHIDTVIERLGDSDSFWELVRKYSVLVLLDAENDYPTEQTITGKDFLADIQTEIESASESIREDEMEYRRLARTGGA